MPRGADQPGEAPVQRVDEPRVKRRGQQTTGPGSVHQHRRGIAGQLKGGGDVVGPQFGAERTQQQRVQQMLVQPAQPFAQRDGGGPHRVAT